MATDTASAPFDRDEPEIPPAPPEEIYDRSSLKGDFMVMMAPVTVQEWERRRPRDQFCEYLDGVVYFHPPKNVSHEQLEASRGIYDRSSLKGDFMVMLDGQTAEDFERFAPDSEFCEYFNGVVYMPSPVTYRHQAQAQFVFHLLDGFRCERGAGDVLTGPAVLRLAPELKPEPDIFVLPPADAAGFQPPAVLVVEFLSPSTRHHDRGTKLLAYQTFGIPEIWMFDDRNHALYAATRFGPGTGYQEETVTAGRLQSYSLPGFWLDVAWLWTDPLPNTRRCLDQILAGSPG